MLYCDLQAKYIDEKKRCQHCAYHYKVLRNGKVYMCTPTEQYAIFTIRDIMSEGLEAILVAGRGW